MRETKLDLVAIVLVALLPAAFYVWGLGLYIDDWGFLWSMRTSPDQSWAGLYAALAEQPALAVRPLQIIWLIAGYKLSPDSILLIHLANQAMFALAGGLLYLALRRVAVIGNLAFALVAVYLSLPHFTTARFWWANHQSGVSLLAFALAVFCLQDWLRHERRYASLAGLVAATTATVLSYALPAFALTVLPFLLTLADRESWRTAALDRRVVVATLAVVVTLAASSAVKLGVGYGASLPPTFAGFVGEAAWLYARAGFTAFWTHGVAAPAYALLIGAGPYGSWAAPLAATMVGAVVFWRTGRAGQRPLAARTVVGMLGAGLMIFGLGYVPFLANFWFGGSPFGTANRAHVAGAMGVAVIFVGLIWWVSASRPAIARALLAVYCAAGVATQVNIGRNWGDAWQEQTRVAARLAAQALPVPEGGTLLLYGHCPFHGVAPIFPPDSHLGRSLAIRTGAPPFRGNTIVSGTRPTARGIEVRNANHIGDLPPGGVYPYRGMVIYDLRGQRRYPIANRAAAEDFFASHPASRSLECTYRGQAGLPLW